MRFIKVPDAQYIDTESKMIDLMTRAANQGIFAYDTETTTFKRKKKSGPDIILSDILIWSMSLGDDRYTIPLRFLPIARPILEDPNIAKAAHNANFDRHMMANHGVTVRGPCFDTKHMYWLLDENQRGKYNLEACAWKFLEVKTPPYKELFGKLNNIMEAPLDKVIDYASKDAWMTMQLYKIFVKMLENDYNDTLGMNYLRYYLEYEEPFLNTLFQMERRGILCDKSYLEDISPAMTARLDEIEQEIYQEVGYPINLNSPKQLREYFFVTCGLEPTSYTDGGASGKAEASVKEEVLEKLEAQGNKVAKSLMEYRKLFKLHSVYVDGMQQVICPDGRIHPSARADLITGRIALSPNLQNIPNPRKDKVFKIRRAFRPAPGKKMIVADYAQVEMRLMALCCKDKYMLDNIQSGKDIHCLNVALMYGYDYDEVAAAKKADEPTEEQAVLLDLRDDIKAIGFGINYLMSKFSLATRLGKSVQYAGQKMEDYFDLYPGILRFIEDSIEQCKDVGYVCTPILGRKRRVLKLGTNNRALKHHAESQVVNSQIQGAAADILKLAMNGIEEDEYLEDLGCHQLLQVHDELIFELDDHVPDEEILPYLREKMERPMGWEFDVPFPVDIKRVPNWYDAK